MKKIKVIDLLNKIANGEEVPEKIKYNNIIYNWDITGYLHYEDETYSERAFLEGYRTDMCLNDEIKIIEDTPKEDKKIPKKLKKKKTINGSFEGKTTYIYKYNEYEIGETINEIIDYLDYLKSKGE